VPVARPDRQQVRVFRSAADFRAWLEAEHERAAELFIGFYKKGVPKLAMTYAEGVDEALCYGWIDGITFRIDDELTATRFTPRRRSSSWSAINIAKIAQLTTAGRMRPAGVRAFEERDRRKDASYSYERPEVELDPEMLERLRADAAAWAYWQADRPAYRRTARHWVMSAKRPETRERRFAELLRASRARTRPKAFLVERAAR
jgi:uncharacterized protein YdeI (YjbR/CyaY-like superfamily)